METSRAGRFEWLAGAAAVLSVLACYGTLLAVSALSLLGVSLAVHPGLWAGAIVLFALLGVLGVWLGYRRHRALAPLLVAGTGAALIVWVMFGSFSRLLELAGFALLLGAVVWDWRLKRTRGALADAAQRY